VLPPSPLLRKDAAWLALARHRFESVHGPIAEEWTVCLAGPSARGGRIAAAVDTALLDALQRTIGECGAVFESAQPYLAAAYNRVRRKIPDETCWLLVPEPGRLTAALIADGTWQLVRSRRVDPGWSAELCETLERESTVAGLDTPCTRVALYGEQALDASDARLQVHDLALAHAGTPETRRHLMVMT
jgi:hypothetical protein